MPSEEPVVLKLACLEGSLVIQSPPMGGWYGGIAAGSGGEVPSKGGMFQMDSPGGGGMYPDIPPLEVLRVVTP